MYYKGMITVEELATALENKKHRNDALTIYLSSDILGENVTVYTPAGSWKKQPNKADDIVIGYITDDNYRTGWLDPTREADDGKI